VPLFDEYRRFYGKPSDISLARAFLLESFEHNQSGYFYCAKEGAISSGIGSILVIFIWLNFYYLEYLRRLRAERTAGSGNEPPH